MSKTVKIRRLVKHDRAHWNPLWQGYLKFYGVEIPVDVTESTFDRLTGGHPDFFAFVAEDTTGQMIGLVHALFHLNTWSINSRCYLEDLFVIEMARGSGAGRALIEAVYAHTDEHGADGVYWFTHHHNATARQLYDRIGTLSDFVRYDRPKAR